MILKLEKQKNYELIDSGNGEKLERYGDFVLSRPDKEAIWNKSLGEDLWSSADLKFKREGKQTKWFIKNGVLKEWSVLFDDVVFLIKPTSFKHIGVFPEQYSNWKWMENLIKINLRDYKEINVLNLFAYTGGATLFCAKAGANVCHVDASKNAVFWAKENSKLSGLEDKPIRFIIDDAIAFLKREIKRGRRYDAIIMDPPSFGHGPKDEIWKIEDDFLKLIELCKELLSDKPLFMLINGYSAGYSSIVYENNLKEIFKDSGVYENGELVIQEKSGKLLPCGIFARWHKN